MKGPAVAFRGLAKLAARGESRAHAGRIRWGRDKGVTSAVSF